MKKILIALGLVITGLFAQAQNGLENIVVEKYYVANAADAAGSTGNLPVGSVTYRIYADMLPGYKFQALYGLPTHTLRLQTSTTFFNNEDYGTTAPNGISVTNTRKNTVMLDSWFSVGATANGKLGVLKTEDTDGSVGNANGILANVDPSAGISVLVQDGMVTGVPEAVTFVGIGNTGNGDLGVFDGISQVGGLFSTTNGSIAALNGAFGPTATNRVLLGQFTTDGIFSFELNVQIGTPTGGTQNYVASNPAAGELTIPSLTQTLGAPNALPTISITAPAGGSSFTVGDVVTIDATAADADGSVTSVEFFVNGVSVGTDNTSPYSATWTSTAGTKTLTAKATDNNGGQTTSAVVTITVGTNAAPTVSITAPVNGTLVNHPAVVTISATAADANGTVSQVEFFVNGVSVNVDATSPYTFDWNSVLPLVSGSSTVLTARATDNLGTSTTSAPVSITIIDPNALPYSISSSVNTCTSNLFCLPVVAVDTVTSVIGYDVVLTYNKSKVSPTGVITVSNALINPAYTTTAHSIDTAAGKINVSVYFNSGAPVGTAFSGTGEIFCVQFVKTPAFNYADTASFSATLQESYFNGVLTKFVDNGSYITYRDTTFNGSLRFWYDNSPIAYNAASPADFLITNIFGNTLSCNSQSVSAVQPDMNGNFVYNITNGPAINIEKNILSTTDVQPVVNGFDAFLIRKVLINDISFIPSIYQMIAMDVNMDGVISAGDLSQVNQRAVLQIGEFRQAWNYNASGVSNGQPSKDWVFIDAATLNANPAYLISATYPANDGSGYSKSNVPVVSFCKTLPILNYTDCAIIGAESYKGVLLGDVNGNFSSVSNSSFRTSASESVVFDINSAILKDGILEVPVAVISNNPVHAVDFAMQLDGFVFTGVQNLTGAEVLTYVNSADNTLRLTSNSLESLESNKTLFVVRFATEKSAVTDVDFAGVQAYINGERSGIAMAGMTASSEVAVYPNPASSQVTVAVAQNASVQLLDMSGRQVLVQASAVGGQNLVLDVNSLTEGMYLVKIFNESFMEIKKIVVKK